MMDRITVHIISLGCSKNLVDAECMARILVDDGVTLVMSCEEARVIVVNTCGFIESAKKDAIDAILAAAEYKNEGVCDYLVVTGCLAQRYKEEIRAELPEVDDVLGTSSYQEIALSIRRLYGESVPWCAEPSALGHMCVNRIVSTKGYAWLKVAEGCRNRCAFCAIPMIRGPYRSRPMEELIEEAKYLASQGFGEIILIAQDTTAYGLDLYQERRLPQLLRELSRIEGVRLLRLMYTYSDGLTDELIEEMAENPKIAHYIDMPIQHGDDAILMAMRRRDTAESITRTVQRLRERMPDIVLRTTVLVGFPGETEEAFGRLMNLVEALRFDRLGAFVYSPEEGTDAAVMENQVPPEIAQERYDSVMSAQQKISLERNQALLGKIIDIVIESVSSDGVFYIGRSNGEAPEIDPSIYVVGPYEPLEIGQRVAVRVVDCSEYELTGETLL